MKKPSKPLIENYKSLESHVVRAGNLTLEMARHPDATPEQITEATSMYRRSYTALNDAREQLRGAFPDNGTYFGSPLYPWNKPVKKE